MTVENKESENQEDLEENIQYKIHGTNLYKITLNNKCRKIHHL